MENDENELIVKDDEELEQTNETENVDTQTTEENVEQTDPEVEDTLETGKEQKKTLKFEGLYAIVPPPGLKFDKIDNELVLSEEYCIMHKKECLKNYDLSMEFYKKLDINKYNNKFSSILY